MDIKYRAYNTLTKTWAGWDSFQMGWNNCKDYFTFYPHPNYQTDGWVIMQYIGRKDNNKIDICELDIVEVVTTGINCRNDKIRGIVKYVDGCFTVEFEKPIYDRVMKCMRERLYVKCFTVNKALKVIGNIYDNYDLMESVAGCKDPESAWTVE